MKDKSYAAPQVSVSKSDQAANRSAPEPAGVAPSDLDEIERIWKAVAQGKSSTATAAEALYAKARELEQSLDLFKRRLATSEELRTGLAQRLGVAEKDGAAWKAYAEHQEHCATCGEAVSDCETGTLLRADAMRGPEVNAAIDALQLREREQEGKK